MTLKNSLRILISLFVMWLTAVTVSASVSPKFDEWFESKTLRLDFILSGDSVNQSVALDGMYALPYWAGRRSHLDEIPLEGAAQVYMNDAESGVRIYAHAFNTLFQEWQHTPEATFNTRSFEQSLLLPYPKRPVNVVFEMRDSHRRVTSTKTFRVDPKDILIRSLADVKPLEYRDVINNGPLDKCIDIVFVAEGYTKDEMPTFYEDVNTMCKTLFSYTPFKEMKRKFNVRAVASPSIDSGTSIPHENVWRQTAVSSNFDTFYSERYLTTNHIRQLQDVLTGIPYEHVIILVNTDIYGGGGIFNFYMISAAHNQHALPVCVHEFGHSFAGLADEYDYNSGESPYYHADVEPWEQNITTLFDFASKWKDMLPRSNFDEAGNLKFNTDKPAGKKAYTEVGLFEGGGYLEKGVYRPVYDCRMRVNSVPAFCPVCQRAIRRVIEFGVGQ